MGGSKGRDHSTVYRVRVGTHPRGHALLTTILLALSSPARAADPTVEAPTAPSPLGAPVTLTFKEPLAGNVHVDGCAAVELEHKEGDKWLPAPLAVCTEPVSALEIKGEIALSVRVESPGTWRARVAWGAGCTAQLPFVMAGCTRLGVATSEPFEITP